MPRPQQPPNMRTTETLPPGRLASPLRAISLRPYEPRDILELPFSRFQPLLVVEQKGEWWYIARTESGEEGWVPSRYVRILRPRGWDVDAGMRRVYEEWRGRVDGVLGLKQRGAGDGDVKRGVEGEGESEETQKKQTQKQNENLEINAKKLNRTTFPYPPLPTRPCSLVACTLRKASRGLGACVHDVEKLLRGSVGQDVYSATWLRAESLKWHPDRVGQKCESAWREEGEGLAGEMFMIFRELIEGEREKESGSGGVGL